MANGTTVALLVRHNEVLILPRGCEMARAHRLPPWWSSSTALADELKNLQRLGELPYPPATIKLVQPEPHLPYIRVQKDTGGIVQLEPRVIGQFTGLQVSIVLATRALCMYHQIQVNIAESLRCVFISNAHDRKGGVIYHGVEPGGMPVHQVLPIWQELPLSTLPALVGQYVGDLMAQEPEMHTVLWLPQGPLPHTLHVPIFGAQLKKTAWQDMARKNHHVFYARSGTFRCIVNSVAIRAAGVLTDGPHVPILIKLFFYFIVIFVFRIHTDAR